MLSFLRFGFVIYGFGLIANVARSDDEAADQQQLRLSKNTHPAPPWTYHKSIKGPPGTNNFEKFILNARNRSKVFFGREFGLSCGTF